MEIKTTFLSRINGKKVEAVYRDIDGIKELGSLPIHSVHAVCFYQGKLVLVYSKKKDTWGPPGGGVEKGEGVEVAVIREVHEETNMRVIKQAIIGLQDNTEFDGKKVTQTRSVCLVEPYGEFVADLDADGDVTEIKLIDHKDYKKYFDCGANGDRMIERALEVVKNLI